MNASEGIPMHERSRLMGMPLDPLTEAETVRLILEGVLARRGGTVLPANLAVLREYKRSNSIKLVMDAADLVVADGMPLVWASWLQGTPLQGRVAGSTMIGPLTAGLAAHGASVFLLGGDPQVASKAAALLEARFSGLRVAGVADPWFDADAPDATIAEVVDLVAPASPGVIYLALPFEKQVRIIPLLRERLPQAWLIGLGVTLSFVTGDIARAPLWAQRTGMEWAHRLAQEPRLYRRYLIEGMPFAGKLAISALKTRASRRKAGAAVMYGTGRDGAPGNEIPPKD